MSDVVRGMVTAFPTASAELTPQQILASYGALLGSAALAFKTDTAYLVRMAETASLITYKRKLWEVRMEVSREVDCPEEVRTRTHEVLRSRGIVSPRRRRGVA